MRSALTLTFLVAGLGSPASSAEPERKALDFLTREVPRWSSENHCYSCHNNGDAARALYDALGRGMAVKPESLATTTAWLGHPERWDKNGGDGPFNDKVLARVQFAQTLAAARKVGAIKDRAPLDRAAARLAEDQAADGFWPVDDGGTPGSPAAYGRPLATLAAARTLQFAEPDRYRDRVARAESWLRARPIATTLDAAVSLMVPTDKTSRSRVKVLERLRTGQSDDGGWGPYADSPSEVFDTSVVLLALAGLEGSAEARALVFRGRAYLVATQSKDGGWPETTRPSGAESYAQRISTTGWATLALMATRGLDLKR